MVNYLDPEKKFGEFVFQKNITKKINEVIRELSVIGDNYLNIKNFGASGDGVNDDTKAFLTVIERSTIDTPILLYVPAGRYKVSRELIFPKNTVIIGDGPNSIIDFTGADPLLFQTYSAALSIAASPPSLIGTCVIPLFADVTITMNTPVSVSENDVLMIWDSVPSSYSNYDANYCQGEIVDIGIQSTSTVLNIKGRIRAHLYKNIPNVYKMDASYGQMSNISVIGPLGIAPLPYGSGIAPINFQYLTRGIIDNVTANNSDYSGVSINKCYNVNIYSSVINKNQYDTTGLSYGVSVNNSQKVTIRDCIISSSRHAITTGGNQYYAIVVRDLLVDNCTLNTTGGVNAVSWHGNTEYCGVTNCSIEGGITLAGRMNFIDHNTIVQGDSGLGNGNQIIGIPILLASVLEPSIRITNNTVFANKKISNNAVWFQFEYDDNVSMAGTVEISGNSFYWNNKFSQVNALVGVLFNYTGTSANNVNAIISNNRLVSSDSVNLISGVRLTGKSGLVFDKVNLRDNEFVSCNVVTTYINKFEVRNNDMHAPFTYGMNISNCNDLVVIDNSVYDFNKVTTGSSTTDTAFYISNCTKAKASGNSGYANVSNVGRYGVSLNAVTTFIGADNVFTNLLLRTYNFATVTNYDVARIKFTSGSLNFPSTAAQSSSDLTVTATGVDLGDIISVGVPLASDTTNSSYSASCVVAGQIRLRFNNYSAAAIDPASGIFKFTVDKI